MAYEDVIKRTILKDKTLVNEINTFENKLLSNENLTFDEFQKFYKDYLNPFVKEEKIDLSPSINESFSEYSKFCEKYTENFESECKNILMNVEENIQGIQYNFNISKIFFFHELRGDRHLMECKIEEPNHLFKKYFSNKNIIIKQVISLEKDICFVLLSNQEKKVTHVLRFNPKLTTKDDLEDLKDIDDSDVQISWGSSSNRYIMFCNTKRKSTYGPLYLCKNLQKVQSFKFITK